MQLLRGVAAILAFLAGLITLAIALYSLAITAAIASETHQPINVAAVVGGLVAGAGGILCFYISRAIDSEHGPVLSYRDRPRKRPRTHTSRNHSATGDKADAPR